MRILSRKKIRDASKEHAEWEASLSAWHKTVKHADWSHFPDVKQSWRNCDAVGNCVVFDISNNKCRLIVMDQLQNQKDLH